MVTLNDDQFHYPEDMASAGSHDQFTFGRAHRAYGSGDAATIFGEGAIAPTPWPSAGRTKKGPAYNQARVSQVLSQPPVLHDFDPRNLHSTQPSVLRHHTEYYMGHEYEQTGRTSADPDNIGNRMPVVYSDSRGRNLILSGHHRATAALLQGRQFRARQVTESD